MPLARCLFTLILTTLLFAASANRCGASYYVPKLSLPVSKAVNSRNQYHYPHMQHFRGHNHTFWGVAGLTCSIIGSAAVVAALVAATASLPTGLPVAGVYVFNILGIGMGIAGSSHDDKAGTTAVCLALVNVLVFFAGVAIYDVATGNWAGLAGILKTATR